MKVDRSMQNLEQLIEIAGGHFALATMLVKRTHELVLGAPSLTKHHYADPLEQALAELIERRYTLVLRHEQGDDDALNGAL